MNTEALIKYLSICVELEKEKYMQAKVIRHLNSHISACQKEIGANDAYLTKMSKNEEILVLDGTNLVYENRVTPDLIKLIEGKEPSKLLKAFIIYYFAALGVAVGFVLKSLILGIVGVAAGLIFGVFLSNAVCKKLKENNKNKAVQNAEMIMNEQTAQIEKRTRRNSELTIMLSNYEEAKRKMVSVHNLTINALNDYYSKNYIPRKYCDIIPVCMFYDYFINKRTFSMERNGADEGAINMYEDECYKRLILSKLDSIIDRLDEISSNQGILYSAICEGNEKTQIMMRSINGNISAVNQNLQVIQYQNEQIKKCAEYSAYSW